MLERMAEGDSEAIYDAVVEAVTELERLREQIGCALSDSDHDVLARIAEVNAARAGQTDTEPVAKECRGKERKRKSASTGVMPANHG